MQPPTIKQRSAMLAFTLAGQRFELENLSAALDQAFLQFFAARLSNGLLTDAAFDQAALAYLSATKTFDEDDKYFNNFTPLWSRYLSGGRIGDAMAVWEYALRPVLALEHAGNKRIHKGTAYYFWGMTALLNDDLELGYLLMHCGVEEDVITHSTRAPDTPGFALVTIDHERPTQAFRPWVQLQANAVERRLELYRQRHARALSLATMRSKLLVQISFRESAFLYSYSTARLSRLLGFPPHLWRGPFPAQLAFDIVFDVCLVIEEAIKAKSGLSDTFIHQAAYLAKAAGLSLTVAELGQLNGQFVASFDATLHAAVTGTLTLPGGGRMLTPIECSLAATYGCRNRRAHTSTPPSLDWEACDALFSCISDTLFLAVESCY
jgi:hypothetical protein